MNTPPTKPPNQLPNFHHFLSQEQETQRPAPSTKNYVVNLLQKSQAKLMNSRKKSAVLSNGNLPLYHHHHHHHHSSTRKEPSPSLPKWVDLIPLIVLLCIFALWWFSYPVDIEIKNGRISVIRQMELPSTLNETRFDLAILATAFPPYSSVSHRQTMENQIAAEPVGNIE